MEEAQIFTDLLVVVGESTKVTDHDASGKKNPSLNMSYHVHNLYIFKRGQLARRVKWQLARVLKGQDLVR